MKTLLITGASRGIGESIARAFSASGYNVVINYNKSREKAEALGKELSAPIFKADVSDISQARELVNFAIEKFGKIDVLVNNAGIAHIGLLQDMSATEWQNVINTNLSSAFNV